MGFFKSLMNKAGAMQGDALLPLFESCMRRSSYDLQNMIRERIREKESGNGTSTTRFECAICLLALVLRDKVAGKMAYEECRRNNINCDSFIACLANSREYKQAVEAFYHVCK